MAQVNLLPWRAQRRRARGRAWLLSLAVGGLLLCALAGYGRWQINRQSQQIALQTASQQAQNQALKQHIARDKTRLAHWQAWQSAREKALETRLWPALLEQIARQLPPGAWLSRLEYQPGQLQIEGQAKTQADLQSSMPLFSQLPGFAPPHSVETEQQADQWRFYLKLTRREP